MGIFGRTSRLTGAVMFVTASAEFDEDRIELVNHMERSGYFNWLKGNNINKGKKQRNFLLDFFDV